MVKQKGILVVLFILVLCVVGCGKKTEIEMNSNYEEIVQLSLSDSYEEESQAYWGQRVHNLAKGEGGYYYLSNSHYIMFLEEETGAQYPVCSKADCNHDCATCNAYIGNVRNYDRYAEEKVYYNQSSIYYYEGNLYLIDREKYLVRFSPDASERTRLMEIKVKNIDSSDTKLLFHDDYVYVYNSVGDYLENGDNTEEIIRYSLSDGKSQVVFRYTGPQVSVSNVRCYGNRLFFTISRFIKEQKEQKIYLKNECIGLYSCDLTTGITGKVIDGQVSDYYINSNDKLIYYYVYGKGLYKMPIGESASVQLYEADEGSVFADVSYDGEYIYLYTGVCSNYNYAAGIVTRPEIIVLNKDGKREDVISDKGVSACNFGDDKFIFAEVRNDDGKFSLSYMSKKDIGKEHNWIQLEQK